MSDLKAENSAANVSEWKEEKTPSNAVDLNVGKTSRKTEWLHIYGSTLMKKDQIQECQITEMADLFNIRCTKVDGKGITLLPKHVKWSRAAEILKEIKDQLDE